MGEARHCACGHNDSGAGRLGAERSERWGHPRRHPAPRPRCRLSEKGCDVFWPGPTVNPRLYRTGPHGLNSAVRPLSSRVIAVFCSGACCSVRCRVTTAAIQHMRRCKTRRVGDELPRATSSGAAVCWRPTATSTAFRASPGAVRFDPRTQQATLVGDELQGDAKWDGGVLAADPHPHPHLTLALTP